MGHTTKTIIEYLEELPEPFRLKALKNTVLANGGKRVNSQAEAIHEAFLWEETPLDEGPPFWGRVHRNLLLFGVCERVMETNH
jgi:hypothetical protein